MIYTEKEPGYIYFNDDYFDLYTAKESLSEREISVIQQTNNAIVTEDMHIITRQGWDRPDIVVLKHPYNRMEIKLKVGQIVYIPGIADLRKGTAVL